MTEHTKEPWRVDDTDHTPWTDALIIKNDEEYIAATYRGQEGDKDGSLPSWANARRIVACVNALAGVPMKDLERCSRMIGPYSRLAALEDILRAVKNDFYTR